MNEFIIACVGVGARVVTDNTGRPRCLDGTWSQLSYQDVVSSFDFSMVPPESIAVYFGTGLGLYITFWALGRGYDAFFKVIK